jgi:Kef-type K+ transport system membrane component KefB
VPHFESRLQTGEVQFNLSMVLLFALSATAMYTGVAAIIGAFLAGMALSETASERVRGLSRGVNELLVPFFLAGIGLHLDLRVFRNGSTILLAAVILGAAILTKLIGCGLGALPLGRRNLLKIGLGMVPRGEVGMVVAQIGLGLAIIKPDTYAVVVFMAVASTVVTPLLLKVAFPVSEHSAYEETLSPAL